MNPPAPVAGPAPAEVSAPAAVIDVGTNSVKLLVARRGPGGVEPLDERNLTTRLGRGFYPGRRLSPEAIAETARAVRDFADRARRSGAAALKVVATSAAREALNADEFLRAVRDTCGLEVEIISGDREAGLSFRGATSSARLRIGDVLVVDVGGGSTEFVLGGDGSVRRQCSVPLGVVRLHEGVQPSDPPTPRQWETGRVQVREFLRVEVAPHFAGALRRSATGDSCRLVGVGGSATVLAAMELGIDRFDRTKLEGTVLDRATVERWERKLWNLTLAERREVRGLPPARADVILDGVCIYAAILDILGFDRMTVTTRGLRYALLEEQP